MTTSARRLLVPAILLGVLATLLLGPGGSPAWALGPGAPPVITLAAAFVNADAHRFGAAPQLAATVQVEIPGGNVPVNVASVSVSVPTFGPVAMPLQRHDLAPQREYTVNLTQAGVPGFPSGTYTFTVTDTSGGVTTTSDTFTNGAGLAPTASITIPGTGVTTSEPGFPPGLVYPSTLTLDLSAHPSPTVSWSAVAGAAAYRVRVQPGGLDQQDVEAFTRQTTGTSMTLPAGALVAGRRYRMEVVAFDDPNDLPTANFTSRNEVEVLTLGPTVLLTFGSGKYTAGQTLDVTARIYNTGPSVTVNVQAWIGTPVGVVVPFLSVSGVTLPTSTGNPSGPNDLFSGSLGLTYTFTGGEPAGAYVVGVRFTDPATGETVAQTTRTFAK